MQEIKPIMWYMFLMLCIHLSSVEGKGTKTCGWGYCNVDGKCVEKGVVDTGNPCNICDPQRNKNKYSYKLADRNCSDEFEMFCTDKSIVGKWDKEVFGIGNLVEATIKGCTISSTESTDENGRIHITIEAGYNESCVNKTSTGNNLINAVKVMVNVITRYQLIERNVFYVYNMECLFKKEALANSIKIDYGEKKSQLAHSNLLPFEGTMSVFKSQEFKVHVDALYTVAQFEPVFVKIENTKMEQRVTMIVKECYATPTADPNDVNKYTYFEKCTGQDDSFKQFSSHGDDDIFKYKINAFRFTGEDKGEIIYLSCKLLICRHGVFDPQCLQTCSEKPRKRSSLAQQDAVNSTSEIREVILSSKAIVVTKLNTCNYMSCPENAYCVDLYPAVCRCIKNYVMNEELNSCGKENLIEVSNFLGTYSDMSSVDFLRLAVKVETEMLTKLKKKNDGIVGVKVIEASRGGSIALDMLIMHAPSTTYQEISKLFLSSVIIKEYEQTNVATENSLFRKINTDKIPTVSELIVEEDENKEEGKEILYIATFLAVFATIAIILIIGKYKFGIDYVGLISNSTIWMQQRVYKNIASDKTNIIDDI